MNKRCILLLLMAFSQVLVMRAEFLSPGYAPAQQKYSGTAEPPNYAPRETLAPQPITSLPLPPDDSPLGGIPAASAFMQRERQRHALNDIASVFTPHKRDQSGAGFAALGGSSPQWTILVLLTLLTLIPSLLICMTPFARLLIVFHFLRQALGLQTTPSNQTLVGLSLIMTFFLMQPVGEAIYHDSIVPMQEGKVSPMQALELGLVPMRHFMAPYIREKDAELFLEIAHEPRPRNIDDLSFRVLLPAYIVSELKSGFQIGAVLFLPFLVVDMVVASIISSVGMMQLPPVVISTPLKLLLFLMVDGWHLLIGSLMRSFS